MTEPKMADRHKQLVKWLRIVSVPYLPLMMLTWLAPELFRSASPLAWLYWVIWGATLPYAVGLIWYSFGRKADPRFRLLILIFGVLLLLSWVSYALFMAWWSWWTAHNPNAMW